jgi:hypothetical protein
MPPTKPAKVENPDELSRSELRIRIVGKSHCQRLRRRSVLNAAASALCNRAIHDVDDAAVPCLMKLEAPRGNAPQITSMRHADVHARDPFSRCQLRLNTF